MPHGAIPFPFGDCRICNDKATGFHYGVATCEGCKGFFKRSIPKGDKYTCFFGGQCNITPFNRNRCKACRFKRCLDNGMAIDAVKMGRIPKVEKERALLEARIQNNPTDSADSKRDGPPTNGDTGHDNWSNSTSAPSQQVPTMLNADLTSQGPAVPDISSVPSAPKIGIPTSQVHNPFSGSEWGTSEEKVSVPVRYALQSGFEASEAGLEKGSGQFQRQQNAWNTGSAAMTSNGNLPLKKSTSVNEEISFAKLVPSTSSSVMYNGPYASQNAREELCAMSSCDPKRANMPRRDNSFQSEMFYPTSEASTPVSGSLPSAQVKIEPDPDVLECPSLCEKEMVFCDNPFSQPASEGLNNFGGSAPLGEMPQVAGFDNKMSDLVLKAAGPKTCPPSAEMCMEINAPKLGPSCKEYGFSKSSHSEVSNREEKILQSRKKMYRRSSYSPDVIKVLLDQVGGERIKGMKQEIMTTIAKTFGPEEYEATAQLLTSYTSSTEAQKSVPSNCFQQRQPEDIQNLPSFTSNQQFQPFTFDSSCTSGPPQQPRDLQRMQSFPGISSSGLFQQNSSNHMTQLSHSGMSSAPISYPGLQDIVEQEPTSMAPQPSQGFQSTEWFDPTNKAVDLPDMSGKPTMGPGDNFYDSNIMDTADSLAEEICSPDVSDQFLSGDYDASIVDLRTSDKISIGSVSQNSVSDKESSSPDSTEIEDMTMGESAMTLATAFENHMGFLREKYVRMQEFLKTKKPVPIHPLDSDGKAKVYHNLITSIPNINKKIIGFCNDIPGFSSLARVDKEALLKHGYYDIWMLTHSKLFHGEESYLQFDDGTFYSRAWMEAILNPSMVVKFLKFANKFNSLNLTDHEVAILCAIQSTAGGHEQVELEGREAIQRMNSHFVDLLVQEVTKHHPSNCSRILVDIFRLMPDLAEINRLQQEIIANFSTENAPEKVEYTPKAAPKADIPEADLAAFDD